jgi:hypothetical protein
MLNRRLPPRISMARNRASTRECPAHRAWVRRHKCSVTGCETLPVECAHVRKGTDGGVGLKPSDRWVISLCRNHHAEQHRLGEVEFSKVHGLNLVTLASEFARQSPHWAKLVRLDRDS